jgi:hypothetical protein
MSQWLDPTGRSTYGLGTCDRCHEKFSIEDLYPDPNSPGLRVCLADLDVLDPYRLPARQTEDISLPFTRPDSPLTNDIDNYFALCTEADERILIFTESDHPIEVEFATLEDFLMLTDGDESMLTDDAEDMIVEEAA